MTVDGPVYLDQQVAMNYRLGAFGWLGGEQYRFSGGTDNLGLLDQAFAMKWVEEHIHSFGGTDIGEVLDPPRSV